MQVRIWKFITAGLVLVIIILCMMTFFLNGSNKNLLIQLNRMDREKAQLNIEYENLYNAYYSYDKKVLKLLETNPNVFWADDSSAYVVYDKILNNVFFAFYNKPNISDEYYFWPYGENLCWEKDADTSVSAYNYNKFSYRVDTLKSHEFIFLKPACNLINPVVAKKDIDNEGIGKKISTFSIK